MINPFFHIARKEWLELRRDGRFRAVAILIAALLLVALLMGVVHQNALRLERVAAQSESRAQWVSQSDKDPHEATHGGFYALKPASPLGVFDPGVTPYLGNAILLESHKRHEATLSSAQSAGVAGRFGALTAASVLQLLVPLLIILLGFGAFAGERDAGTLHQLLSLGVAPSVLARGKVLGVALSLAVLLVPAALIGALAVGLGSGGEVFSGHWAVRILGLALGYTLYFGTFVALTLAVSAWTRTARGALIFLLGFWVVASLFTPRLVGEVARARYQTPSSLEWNALVEDAKKAASSQESGRQRIKRIQTRLMKQYGVTRVADLPVNYRGVMLEEAEDTSSRVYETLYNRLWSGFARQNRLYEGAASLTPFLAMRSLSMGFSSTDFGAHRHFADETESYRRSWVSRMNEALARHKMRPGQEFKAGRALWESVPAPHYQWPGFGPVIAAQYAALGALAGWLVLSCALLWMATRRLVVR